MIQLLQSIPAKVRQAVYFGYGAIVFALGGLHVGLVAAAVTKDPVWLTVVDEVVKYCGIPIAAVAGINVTTTSTPAPAPGWPDPEAGAPNSAPGAPGVVGGGLDGGPVAEGDTPPLQ